LDVPPLDCVHSSLYKEELPNPARGLLACLLLSWGCMRLGAGARTSYLLEAAMFAYEVCVSRRVHAARGAFVSLLSLALAFVVPGSIRQSIIQSNVSNVDSNSASKPDPVVHRHLAPPAAGRAEPEERYEERAGRKAAEDVGLRRGAGCVRDFL
jgi:hypothetical protein